MRSLLGALLFAAAIGGAVRAEVPADPLAESEPAQPPSQAEAIEEIIITGTRIRREQLRADSPIAVLDEEALRSTATVNVEDAIRELPMALPGVTSVSNNGNPGAATVNLRGLDDERTLVLVDGKRFMGYDSEGIVDVNNIPTGLLERIDVVTGGASAVYGSDAMAGVVNFILKRDFEGALLESTLSIPGRGDGRSYDLATTVGKNFADGRGNATLFVSWTDRDEVKQSDRSYSEALLDPVDGSEGGSRTVLEGAFLCPGASVPPPTSLCRDPGNFTPTPFVQFDASGDLEPQGNQLFNFAPYNLFQVPQRRVQATGLGRYDLSDRTSAYARASFSRTVIDNEIAPSGTFFEVFDFPLTYPFWTPQSLRVFADRDADGLLDQIEVNGIAGFQPADFVGPSGEPGDEGDVGTVACPSCAGNNAPDAGELIRGAYGKRFSEVGSRRAVHETVAYQVVFGLRGDLPWLDSWSWDVSYQYGRTQLSRSFENDLSNPNIQALLDGCPVGSPPGCVVGNVFGAGTLSAAATDFITLDIRERVNTDQQVAMLSFSGDLGERLRVPGAGPIGAAVGAEWRRETSDSHPNDCYATPGCSPGFGTTHAVASDYDVTEIFGELLVPLLDGRRFASSLELETGVRYSDYSTVGGVTAWKLGSGYEPISQLRFRAMFQRAVRAPNIFEFGSSIVPALEESSGDPCAAFNDSSGSTTVSAEIRDLCVATGAPASRFVPLPSGDYTTFVPDGIFGTLNTFVGGNPELEEERSDTITAGFIYQGDWQGGVTLELDWYRIEIHNAIHTLTADDVLRGCYDPAFNPARDPNTRLCGFVKPFAQGQGGRDPITGGLVGSRQYGVNTTAQNIAKLEASGLDFHIELALDLGGRSRLELSFLATYALTDETLAVQGFPVTDCLGRYGFSCLLPTPEFRSTQRIAFVRGDYELGVRWRYVSGSEIDQRNGDIDMDPQPDPLCLPRFCEIGGSHYFDFSFGWQPSNIGWLEGFELTLGLENAFDEDPPLVGGLGNGNTYPEFYDTLGRTFTARFAKRF